MRYLLELAREYGLERVADRVLDNKNVHGIVVSVDPFWLRLWRLSQNYGDRALSRWWRILRDFGPIELTPFIGDQFLDPEPPKFNCVTPIDLQWRPPYWADIFEKRSNLVVNIHLRPGAKFLELDSQKNESSLIIRQIHCPIATMAANPKTAIRPIEGGLSIGNASGGPSGTLGGILVDHSTSDYYAVSCAHVFSKHDIVHQPSLTDDPGALRIGECVLSENPKANTGTVCNPRNPSSLLNDMDVSLIKLDHGVGAKSSVNNIGNINGYTPAADINSGLLVDFTARSGFQSSLVVNGIGFVKQIQDLSGSPCCYRDLVQLRYSSTCGSSPHGAVQSGDSGTWAITNGASGKEWCAMIVAEDQQSGYAIMSEDILNFLNDPKHGFNLSVK